ncbi:MAG: hypothetical protein E6R03_16510 [Hyphomicrobiaceae bacterium]|nr:MAG: hypothetical protein E6R03_16510 [Hyphomicrobiaceae bacterium]
MTTAQVAVELGFAESTVIKLAAQLGGYRSSARGPYRFPRATVQAYKGKEAELRKPNATIQALAKEVADLTALGIERENRFSYELQKLTRRLETLEKRSTTVQLERIAA